MSLTPEQRAEISRQNGKKSQGPVTPEGKEKSRRNAMKHGLRAEVLALPNEDPEAVAARADAWNDYYKPHSPAAQHLVTQCVQATLLADRIHRAHAAALTKQVRDAYDDWDRDREDQVAALKALLKTDPAEAVRLLKRTSEGCIHLLARWEQLDEKLVARGHWTGPERDEAIRMLGFDPDPEALKDCPEAWLTRLHNLMCHEKRADRAVDWMFDPKRSPDAFRGVYRADWLPDPEFSHKALREMVAGEMVKLDEEDGRLSAERDDPDRAEAPDRAMVLQDAPSARLFLRYHAEARLSFQKAYSELVKALERDKAEPAGTGQASPTPAAAVSPDEPGGAAGSGATVVATEGDPATESEAPRTDAPADPGRDRVSPNDPAEAPTGGPVGATSADPVALTASTGLARVA